MGVQDIIGTDAAEGMDEGKDTGKFDADSYSGYNPNLMKNLYGQWSCGQVALGVLAIMFRWNIDNDNDYTSHYEKMWRIGAVSLIGFYGPAGLMWWRTLTLNKMKAPLHKFYLYYFLSVVTMGMPLVGWFVVQVYYLWVYSLGNASGLYVSNKV